MGGVRARWPLDCIVPDADLECSQHVALRQVGYTDTQEATESTTLRRYCYKLLKILRMHKKLFAFAVVFIIAGVCMMIGGIGGIAYTYKSISAEHVVTTEDSAIPNKPVRGPFTMKAQADVIRVHTMTRTSGLVFAQMPRTIPKLDEAKNPVLDEKGEPVMVANELRSGAWMPALTLMTSLQLGIVSYAFSLFALVVGLLFVMNGCIFLSLRKNL